MPPVLTQRVKRSRPQFAPAVEFDNRAEQDGRSSWHLVSESDLSLFDLFAQYEQLSAGRDKGL